MSSPDNKSVGFRKEIDKDFGTKVCHISQEPEQWNSMDVVPPITMTSTFKLKEPIATPCEYLYSRVANPSRDVLEHLLASIENAKHGLCFSSGLGALTAVFSMLKSGSHVLCVDEIYGGSYSFFSNIAKNFDVETSFLNADDPQEFVNAMKPNTRMIWLESPTNPTLKVWDVEEICKLAKRKSEDVIIVLDNSFLTSYFQKPLELGCDIAFYSASKYLNGHSDVIMGSVALNDDKIFEKLHNNQIMTGIIPSPMNCFLVNRGLKTLHLRMEQHMRNGLAVGKFLQTHPAVKNVLHPGLPSHPNHELALKQWSGCSGIVSFYHKYGLEESKTFLKNLKLFSLAVSLGGYESLAQLPSTMTHASVPREEREKLNITDNLIRLSVGIESVEDIIKDLDQALTSISVKDKVTQILIHG